MTTFFQQVRGQCFFTHSPEIPRSRYSLEHPRKACGITEHSCCVTKAERSNMQDLWQEVSLHSLFSFGVCSLRSRECGLYEATDLVLGDQLCGKFLTIKWIDVSQPQQRRRRLIHHSKLMELKQKNPDIFEENLLGVMEDVCVYNFVAE